MQGKPVLACITAQPHCANIINAAKILAENLETDLIVITSQPLKQSAQERAKSVKCLKNLSKECDVDITVCYSDAPAKSIAAQARKYTPIHIFIGEGNNFLNSFSALYPFCPISLVGNGVICTIPAEYDILKTAN